MSLLYDLFDSYYDARTNKRNTINQLAFEFDLEKNLLQLHQDLVDDCYTIGPSIHFIQFHPVKREIFAGNFRDRVIHHLIYNYLNPLCEKTFIYDSYSCRVKKGTIQGIKRIHKFIRSCSQNYTIDCYILKLDIQGYFMSINKDILYHKIEDMFTERSDEFHHPVSLERFLQLIHKVIYHDPTKDSFFKGNEWDYEGLPPSKSLFFTKPNCGLPIGNLTSQLFSNIYLHDLDVYITKVLGLSYYGRYVDDFVIVHRDKAYLQKLVNEIWGYLQDHLSLTLHPKKVYLQHYSKGVLFLGQMIKPYRRYIRKRTFGYFYTKLNELTTQLSQIEDSLDLQQVQKHFLAVINSYLGFFKGCKSYQQRKQIIEKYVHPSFREYFSCNESYTKITRLHIMNQKSNNGSSKWVNSC